MANETHSGTGSVGYSIPSPVEATVIAEIREAIVSPVFARMQAFPEPGLAKIFPRVTTAPTVTALSNGATEEDADTPTTIVLTNPTATVGVKTASIRQSDLSIEASAANWMAEAPKLLARALADKLDLDVCALLGGFSTTAGTSGVDASLEDLRAAAVALRILAKGDAEGAVFVLHPTQLGDVESGMMSGAGAGLSNLVQRPDFMSVYGGNAGQGAMSAYRGHLMGIPVFQSTNVAATGGNRTGALLVPGMAIACLYKWLARVVMADQAVNFQAAKSWLGSSCYGAIEIDDNRGVSIITDE